jgi:hypothetical protein
LIGSIILDDTNDYVDVTVGLLEMQDDKDRVRLQKDYRVSGEVWRVHKADADPYPSKPHAHCIGGSARFIGLKLHLGTAGLYQKNEWTGYFLERKSFDRLINLIQPTFPSIPLPLKS